MTFELISDLHAEALQGGGSTKPSFQKPSWGKPSLPMAPTCCAPSSSVVKTATIRSYQDNVVDTTLIGGFGGLNATAVRDQFNSATISVSQ